MKIRLIERGADNQPVREIPLTQEEFLIGRGTDCDLRLPDAEISRHHCLIRLGHGEAVLVDLGSANGSYVNDHRVRSQAELHSGDELKLGVRSFVVDLGDLAGITLNAHADPGADTVRRYPPAKDPPK